VLLCAWLETNVEISVSRKENTHHLFHIELKLEVGVLRHEQIFTKVSILADILKNKNPTFAVHGHF
jgi:hypothetical protein